jgi:hypothetical protein
MAASTGMRVKIMENIRAVPLISFDTCKYVVWFDMQ